jgi:hypothetical protein
MSNDMESELGGFEENGTKRGFCGTKFEVFPPLITRGKGALSPQGKHGHLLIKRRARSVAD